MTSACAKDVLIFPTLLASWPKRVMERVKDTTLVDVAIAYLAQFGFQADRTRMDLFGHPGLFRELGQPPPWIEVTPDDVDGVISADHQKELRPLYLQAHQLSIESLRHRYKQHLMFRRERMQTLGITAYDQTRRERILEVLEDKLRLARCIGPEIFENLYQSIFDFEHS